MQTVADYFDWMVLLNVRILAQGPVEQVYTAEHLRCAYGEQFALLNNLRLPQTPAAQSHTEQDALEKNSSQRDPAEVAHD